MKRILYAAYAGLFCFAVSCNDSARVASENTTGSDEAAKNLAACRMVSDAFGSGDVSKLDSAVASDMVDHTERGEVRGLDSLKAMIKHVKETNSDMKMDIVHELADKDYVMQWMHFTGVNKSDPGMPMGPYDMHGLQIMRMKDNKIAEHWGYMDPVEMMKMMPQMGKPSDMMKMDTAKAKK
jgi:predicted SnoaL-like aldol condensation-catalyzing enzyme